MQTRHFPQDAFSWLLGQPIKDTLCGTKALWKSDYERIAANRHYFGDFDPFGDFDLLFGAAKLNLRIVEIPIRYRNRKYGKTTDQEEWIDGSYSVLPTAALGFKMNYLCLMAGARLVFDGNRTRRFRTASVCVNDAI